MPLSHDLVLLAGGRGTRLGGVTKPLLRDASGVSLLERALDTLPFRHAFVVAPADLHPRLSPVCGDRAQLLEDPGEGPALALLAAAAASTARRVLLSAADHPTPSRALAARLLASPGSAWVVGPQGPEPLMSVLERAPLLSVPGPPRSARRLIAPLGPHEIPLEALSDNERRGLEDVDEPAALASYGLCLPDDVGPGTE